MKIAFYGGQTAGLVTLLALLAQKVDVRFVIAEDENVHKIARNFNLELRPKESLENKKFISILKRDMDFFICCHGKKILSADFVNTLKCINLHPCFYKYKGARPIRRLIKDNNPRISVASHWMSEKVDIGKTIVEIFKIISNVSESTEAEIYNELYPLYVEVIIRTLKRLT